MPKYTTGEIAKLCSVTVRTVQYYDSRGILVPSELSEGGRRLYSDRDLEKMKTICFLRDLGISIDTIKELIEKESNRNVILLLLTRQEEELTSEIEERREKLKKLEDIRKELGSADDFSFNSIGGMAHAVTDRKKLRKFRTLTVLTGIPVSILQWVAIILWITKGMWWLFVIWAALAIPYAVIFSRVYYKKIAYICPECHTVFRPPFKEMFFAGHTPTTRKLTCPACGRKGYCVETPAENLTGSVEAEKT